MSLTIVFLALLTAATAPPPVDLPDEMSAVDIVERDYADDEFVYDGEVATTEDQPEGDTGATSDQDSGEAATGTIYQRRGGGIKRRVAAMHIVENDEAS